MQQKHSRARQASPLLQTLLATVLTGFILLTSGCGGSPQSQQQANQNKAQLDQTLQHAKDIGVPPSYLQPILKQEQQLSTTSAPFSLFNDQPATNYYLNLATRYHQLLVQAQGIISTVTGELSTKAQLDMQHFQSALAKARSLNTKNIETFAQQYNNDSSLLAAAQYPKDFAAISSDARTAIETLGLLQSTFSQLATFNNTIKQMQAAHLDVTAMQAQYQSDMTALNNTTASADFRNLSALIDAQYQEAVANSILALPFVGAAKLSQFKTGLDLLKTYGMDSSSYQKLYDADQAAMKKARTIHDYLVVSQHIDADIASMHDDLIQGASHYLIGELDRQARAWGQAHAYHDKFDGNNYIYTAGYTTDGIGFWLNRELSWAWQPSDFQAVVDDENNEFFNLQMLEQDYSDPTPYNQVHATDMLMMQHYPSLQKGTVLMISLVEQALRFYKDGKLIRAFHVTTGRVERPSLPGVWTVQNRQSPTVFKSTEPKDSPYWYPDTPIKYAILYHWGGFFVHDAWWRVDFGPGTQFPHYDSGGDESFAGNGSHGCVNMQSDDAAWVYANTDWNTQIAIY